jgi:hypothetical protein
MEADIGKFAAPGQFLTSKIGSPISAISFGYIS